MVPGLSSFRGSLQLEAIPTDSNQLLFAVLHGEDQWDYVDQEWTKACARCKDDPSGAITSARSLLESVCKHILDGQDIAYKESEELPHLYYQVASSLQLAPSQHEDTRFKAILGSSQTVVSNLAALRNTQGDAHGKGQKAYRPLPKHARLAVGFAGTLASFLIETWQEQQKKAA